MTIQEHKNPSTHNSIFSLEQLNRICNNDPEFIHIMLNEFITNATECNAGMRSFLFNNSWDSIKAMAHKNILSFSVLGLNEQVGILKYIDQNASKKEKQTQVTSLIDILCKKNTTVIEAMKDLLKFIDSETTELVVH